MSPPTLAELYQLIHSLFEDRSLLDRWIETFNRNQTPPTAKQLQRLGALLDSVASLLPEKTASWLRFSLKPL